MQRLNLEGNREKFKIKVRKKMIRKLLTTNQMKRKKKKTIKSLKILLKSNTNNLIRWT